ncbi:hypothetical protein STRIP9103_03336 [Streptomyces ipomoeae 91-03]|uniref:Uncharacterized protein n=1 Tax=Streptomyces ipomoeae 91-03 TaxID=698759 RepID=L1L8L7_9ACTN|nr:hypothetical protein STRIP9103_03336 [Streptomyces ipomoeae 91-03]
MPRGLPPWSPPVHTPLAWNLTVLIVVRRPAGHRPEPEGFAHRPAQDGFRALPGRASGTARKGFPHRPGGLRTGIRRHHSAAAAITS